MALPNPQRPHRADVPAVSDSHSPRGNPVGGRMTWDRLQAARPLRVGFDLLPSQRTSRQLCPVLTVSLPGIHVVRILDPELREPFVSLSPIFQLGGLSTLQGLLAFDLRRARGDYDLTLAGLEPYTEIWAPLSVAREVAGRLKIRERTTHHPHAAAAQVSVREKLDALLSWNSRFAWSLDEGSAGLTHNWHIPTTVLDPGRYSTSSLLTTTTPHIDLLPAGEQVRTLVSAEQRLAAQVRAEKKGADRAIRAQVIRWSVAAHEDWLQRAERGWTGEERADQLADIGSARKALTAAADEEGGLDQEGKMWIGPAELVAFLNALLPRDRSGQTGTDASRSPLIAQPLRSTSTAAGGFAALVADDIVLCGSDGTENSGAEIRVRREELIRAAREGTALASGGSSYRRGSSAGSEDGGEENTLEQRMNMILVHMLSEVHQHLALASPSTDEHTSIAELGSKRDQLAPQPLGPSDRDVTAPSDKATTSPMITSGSNARRLSAGSSADSAEDEEDYAVPKSVRWRREREELRGRLERLEKMVGRVEGALEVLLHRSGVEEGSRPGDAKQGDAGAVSASSSQDHPSDLPVHRPRQLGRGRNRVAGHMSPASSSSGSSSPVLSQTFKGKNVDRGETSHEFNTAGKNIGLGINGARAALISSPDDAEFPLRDAARTSPTSSAHLLAITTTTRTTDGLVAFQNGSSDTETLRGNSDFDLDEDEDGSGTPPVRSWRIAAHQRTIGQLLTAHPTAAASGESLDTGGGGGDDDLTPSELLYAALAPKAQNEWALYATVIIFTYALLLTVLKSLDAREYLRWWA